MVVAEAEGCVTTPEGLDACVSLGVGDMRKSLNILQSTHMAFEEISVANVYQCTGSPTPETVEAVLQTLVSDEFDVAFQTAWNIMRLKGLALQDILSERCRARKSPSRHAHPGISHACHSQHPPPSRQSPPSLPCSPLPRLCLHLTRATPLDPHPQPRCSRWSSCLRSRTP